MDKITQRILIITGDPLGKLMAGPAIRAWNMAQVLTNAGHNVQLVSTSKIDEDICAPFGVSCIIPSADNELDVFLEASEIVIFQGLALWQFPKIIKKAKYLVADIYDPMHLEQLEQQNGNTLEAWSMGVKDTTALLNQQLLVSDFFLAASERQRLFWLGQLAGLGRVNPKNYIFDSDLRKLIDVVPFGIPEADPVQNENGIRVMFPQISSDTKIVLWGGGIYNWFDPLSLVQAVHELNNRNQKVALVFLGVGHPNSDVPEMEMVRRTRQLVDELDGANQYVFFNEGWVPYERRADYLLDADVGVSTHFQHIETTFSFRTRILDYLWAGLPILSTAGDGFADLIQIEKIGYVVAEKDVTSIREGLATLLFNDEEYASCKRNINRVRELFKWEVTLSPLIDYCSAPHKAPDLVFHSSGRRVATTLTDAIPIPITGFWALPFPRDLRQVWLHLRAGGITLVIDKIIQRQNFRKTLRK